MKIFHNPRCSKSREALALLQARVPELEVHDYLNDPLDLAQLQHLHRLLAVPVREMLRSSEAAHEALGLADATLSEDALLAAIAAHPVLLQRPIVVSGGRAVIARPPELALGLSC